MSRRVDALGVELCTALGLDHRAVRRLVLTVNAGALPILEVTYTVVDTADAIGEVVRRYQLLELEPPEHGDHGDNPDLH